jgi:hypothetical protein
MQKSDDKELERVEMIASAAYYRAEHRGSMSGNAEDGWLNAEAEIDADQSHPD